MGIDLTVIALCHHAGHSRLVFCRKTRRCLNRCEKPGKRVEQQKTKDRATRWLPRILRREKRLGRRRATHSNRTEQYFTERSPNEGSAQIARHGTGLRCEISR